MNNAGKDVVPFPFRGEAVICLPRAMKNFVSERSFRPDEFSIRKMTDSKSPAPAQLPGRADNTFLGEKLCLTGQVSGAQPRQPPNTFAVLGACSLQPQSGRTSFTWRGRKCGWRRRAAQVADDIERI